MLFDVEWFDFWYPATFENPNIIMLYQFRKEKETLNYTLWVIFATICTQILNT